MSELHPIFQDICKSFGMMPKALIKATCMGCNKWSDCGQVHDIGFVCSDCRGKFAPPERLMKQISQELDVERCGVSLTDPQKKMLREAEEYRLDDGRHSWGPRGFRRAGKERMAKKLVEYGLLSEYVHGGFDITPKGLEVLKSL